MRVQEIQEIQEMQERASSARPASRYPIKRRAPTRPKSAQICVSPFWQSLCSFRVFSALAVEGLSLRACTAGAAQRPATSSPEATARASTSGAPPNLQPSKLPNFQSRLAGGSRPLIGSNLRNRRFPLPWEFSSVAVGPLGRRLTPPLPPLRPSRACRAFRSLFSVLRSPNL